MMETVEREKNKNWWKITERGRKRAENSARQKKKVERKKRGRRRERERKIYESREKKKRKEEVEFEIVEGEDRKVGRLITIEERLTLLHS